MHNVRIDTIHNEEEVTRYEGPSEEGRVYVRVNNLDVLIKQTPDGEGLVIDVFDVKTGLQELGTMCVWFSDAEDEEVV